MAVVIRLQGLPFVAGSVDIRHFFSGLNIPDGGVHIIGGKIGEAFIIFSTDEDARRAMSRTGGVIKNSHVQLFLSSKTEMQNNLEMNRRSSRKHPAVPPGGDTFGENKGVNHNNFDENIIEPGLHASGTKHNEAYTAKYDKREVKISNEADVYVFMYGLPYSATEEDVRNFFSGLDVVDIIFLLRKNGMKNGNGLVKFSSAKEATLALDRNNEYIGTRFISIKKTSVEHWISVGGQVAGTHSKQPRKQRSRSRSPQNQQLYLQLKNLPYSVEREDIKDFLGIPDLPDSQIKLLLGKHQNKTGEGFVMLKSEWQFEKCLALHKNKLKGRPIIVLPIPRKEMLDLIESYESRSPKVENLIDDCPSKEHEPLKRWVYLRNFPFDVTKVEVMSFFAGFSVHEDDVFLLFDSNGVGLGEALVKFPSLQQALLAESLNRQRFLDTEILLRCISDEQMKEFSLCIDKPVENVLTRSPMYRDEYDVREPVQQSYALHDDLAYGRRDFRGSPERFPGSNPLEFVGPDKYAGGKFDKGHQSNIDYQNSLPFHNQSLEGRSRGAFVRMKNLPFKATMEEILDFFYGYHVTRNSVKFRFTNNGMATGYATVYFENYDEAMAAVKELNERPIGTRKIYLHLTRL